MDGLQSYKSEVRINGPVIEIRRGEFQGKKTASLVFMVSKGKAGSSDFDRVSVALDLSKAGTDKRHDPDTYAAGVETDIAVVPSVNFQTNQLILRLADGDRNKPVKPETSTSSRSSVGAAMSGGKAA